MTLLRGLRSILLGETWTLPLGVGAIVLAGVLLREVDPALWRDVGGAVLLAGVLAVLALAAPRPVGHGRVRVVVLLIATVIAAVFAWSRYGPRTAPPAAPVADSAFSSARSPVTVGRRPFSIASAVPRLAATTPSGSPAARRPWANTSRAHAGSCAAGRCTVLRPGP